MSTYQRAQVVVDDHFARFGSKSYAINQITSVDVRVEQKQSTFAIILAVFGALIALAGISELVERGNPSLIPVGIGLTAAGVWLFKISQKLYYHLTLATAAGEVQAMRSEDPSAIDELRRAIESRIARSET